MDAGVSLKPAISFRRETAGGQDDVTQLPGNKGHHSNNCLLRGGESLVAPPPQFAGWGEKMKMIVFLLGFFPFFAYCDLGMAAAEQGSPGTGLQPWTCSRLFHRLLCFRLVVPQFPHLSDAGANLCPPFPHLQCSWGPLGELRGLRWEAGFSLTARFHATTWPSWCLSPL